MTPAQRREKSSLLGSAALFTVVGIATLTTFGAALVPSIFAGAAFLLALSQVAKASVIGAPAPVHIPAAAPSNDNAWLAGLFGFGLGRAFAPSRKVVVGAHHHTAPAARSYFPSAGRREAAVPHREAPTFRREAAVSHRETPTFRREAATPHRGASVSAAPYTGHIKVRRP